MRSFVCFVVFVNLLNALAGILYLAGLVDLTRTPGTVALEIICSVGFALVGVVLITEGRK